MPRRNVYLLALVAVVSFVCYRKADSRNARMFETFSEIVDQVEANYIDQVDQRELFENALHGMINRLDPYSMYLGEKQTAASNENLNQEFGGIGIELTTDPKTNRPIVATPLLDTPAYRAGILAGDVIVKINGVSTEGFRQQDFVDRLRGRVGEEVTLSILHRGEDEPVDVTIRRAVIQVDSVLGDHRLADGHWDYMLEGHPGIGYVRCTQFGYKTVDELTKVLDDLKRGGMKGLILDLRNNNGGLLDAAVDTCNLFVRSGQIVTTRGRDGTIMKDYQASGNAPFAELPMVVLINDWSASAAEIVAACLQDHHRAVIVGERSFGKGSVQNIIELERGKSEMRLTVARYWRPSGANIHRTREARDEDEWGVRPDPGFEVKLEGEDAEKWVLSRRARDIYRAPTPDDPEPAERFDPPLDKALEALEAEMAQPREAVAT